MSHFGGGTLLLLLCKRTLSGQFQSDLVLLGCAIYHTSRQHQITIYGTLFWGSQCIGSRLSRNQCRQCHTLVEALLLKLFYQRAAGCCCCCCSSTRDLLLPRTSFPGHSPQIFHLWSISKLDFSLGRRGFESMASPHKILFQKLAVFTPTSELSQLHATDVGATSPQVFCFHHLLCALLCFALFCS